MYVERMPLNLFSKLLSLSTWSLGRELLTELIESNEHYQQEPVVNNEPIGDSKQSESFPKYSSLPSRLWSVSSERLSTDTLAQQKAKLTKDIEVKKTAQCCIS